MPVSTAGETAAHMSGKARASQPAAFPANSAQPGRFYLTWLVMQGNPFQDSVKEYSRTDGSATFFESRPRQELTITLGTRLLTWQKTS